ncbi:MAG: pilus assembly protein PilM [Chitinispirillaceae bacterium]|nr:pilus assembly protein PilM [Chitinispirillaceae bacterium]
MPKGTISVGIEIDSQSIRAAKIACGKSTAPGAMRMLLVEEITGTFTKDEEIIEGLGNLRQKLSIGSTDTVVTCVGGKQAYAAQLNFRKMPDDEMKTALKFEIRKNLSFDTAGATVEYQFLAEPPQKNDPAPVIVTAVANVLLQRTLRLFEKAGIPPTIVDVFPLVVANANWSATTAGNGAAEAVTVLHIGPDYSTLVIDGAAAPFYNRTIYFSAAELFGATAGEGLAAREIERRITGFTEEINRSITFYEGTYKAKTAAGPIMVTGTFCLPELLAKITQDIGLATSIITIPGIERPNAAQHSERFNIAITLGMRGCA